MKNILKRVKNAGDLSMGKKYLIQCFLLLNGWTVAATGAPKGCGPFQMPIVRSDDISRDISRGPSEDQKDTFAASAEKGNLLLSNAPFFFLPGDPVGFDWTIAAGDSYLAQQNTLLEIKGYLEKLEGVKLPADFLAADRIDGHLAAFEGMSARKFMEADLDIPALLERAFPGAEQKELRQQIVDGMKKQSSIPFEERHFSRRSFLSSDAVKKTFGEAAILACMAFGYASDAYVNEDKEIRRMGPQMAARSLQSSVIDYLASEAFKLKANEKEPSAAEIMLAKGEITCKLSLTKGFELEVARCGGGVLQTDPVVREGTKANHLFVQLGKELYSAKCVLPGGKQIDLSQGQPLHLDDLLRKSDFDSKKPVEKYLAENLASLTSQDKQGVMAARKLCDEEIRRLERGTPEAEGKKMGVLPRRADRSLATVQRPRPETSRGMHRQRNLLRH